jgi:hypothetical protein
LTSAAEFGRLTQVMDHGKRCVQAIAQAHTDAQRHLDSAEVALDRLMAEIRQVMPVTPRSAGLIGRS